MRHKRTAILAGCALLASAPHAKTLDVCFSPRGHCDQVLISWIDASRHSIDGAIYNLTHPRIADALIRAHARGVRVRVIKNAGESRTEGVILERLRAAGMPLRLQKGSGGGLQHHKFMVIDAKYVITGSFNWTRAAVRRNDENFVILDDQAPAFEREFRRLWSSSPAAEKPPKAPPSKDQ